MRLGPFFFLVVGCVARAPSQAAAPPGATLVVECDQTPAPCERRAEARCPRGYRLLEKEKTRRVHDPSLFKDPNARPPYVDHFKARVQCL